MSKKNSFNDPNAILQLFGALLQQQASSEELEEKQPNPRQHELISDKDIDHLTKHLSDISKLLEKIRMLLRMSIKSTFNIQETSELTQFSLPKIYRDTSQNEVKFTKHFGKTLQFKKEDLEEYMLKEKSNYKPNKK